MFKINSTRIGNKYSNIFFILLLALIVSYITYRSFQIHMDIGALWDTYDLLSDAALFAGKSIGYYDLLRPPFLPFLTSLFFRFGGLATWPIMLIDGLIFILGSIGLYLFFRLRFDNLTSFLGALLFSTFPIVLTWIAAGITDISSVCISIWALFFTVMAIKKDSRFFYISFPLAMVAFLTRFSSALLIFPIFLYIMMNVGEIKRKKDILIGISLSFLVITPILWLFYINFGNPLNTFLNFFSSSSGSVSVTTANSMQMSYNTDFFYFIKSMPSLIGPAALGVILVIFLGFLIYLYKRFNKKRNEEENKDEFKRSFQILLRKNGKIKLLVLLLLVIIFVFTIQRVHYLLSEVIFSALLYLLYDLLKNFKFKNMDIDLLFLSWFMMFFIFQSVYIIKAQRYFIFMAPAVSYFLMRGFRLITSQLGFKIKNRNITPYLFSVFLIFLIIFSTFTYLPTIEENNKDMKQINQDTITISAWLVKYDPNYKNKIIYTDLWPYYGWYLQKNVTKMPIFINNQVVYAGTKSLNFTAQDIAAYNNKLNSNHADYFISYYVSEREGMYFTNYRIIKKVDYMTLYQRIGS